MESVREEERARIAREIHDELGQTLTALRFDISWLASRLAARRPDLDFSWLMRQRGMFSLLGLEPRAIATLCEVEHIYMTPDGRINVAGVSDVNVGRVADSIVRVLERR